MKYIAEKVNGQSTRNKFIRSMDIASCLTVEDAIVNYENTWFSSKKKQYLNTALKNIKAKSLFWPKSCLCDMLDEIAVDYEGLDKKELELDIDVLKSEYINWSKEPSKQKEDKLISLVKAFEGKYSYECPPTYRSAWMNTGAYVTLSYEIKYENMILPGCSDHAESLDLLKKCALEVIAEANHFVDDRMFKKCYEIYKNKLIPAKTA